MNKVLVIGDIHGDFDRLNELIGVHEPGIILQCGDFGYWPRLDDFSLNDINVRSTKVYFCDGNIDDIADLNLKRKDSRDAIELGPGIFYMPRGSVLTLPDGRRVLFMGGAMSRDMHQRHPGWDWFSEEILNLNDIENLPECQIDIVVSHTCPQEFNMENHKARTKGDIDPSQAILSQILQRYKPSLWFFGHWHMRVQGTFDKTRWIALSWAREMEGWVFELPE